MGSMAEVAMAGFRLGVGMLCVRKSSERLRRSLAEKALPLILRVSHTLRKYHVKEMNHTLTQRGGGGVVNQSNGFYLSERYNK